MGGGGYSSCIGFANNNCDLAVLLAESYCSFGAEAIRFDRPSSIPVEGTLLMGATPACAGFFSPGGVTLVLKTPSVVTNESEAKLFFLQTRGIGRPNPPLHRRLATTQDL